MLDGGMRSATTVVCSIAGRSHADFFHNDAFLLQIGLEAPEKTGCVELHGEPFKRCSETHDK